MSENKNKNNKMRDRMTEETVVGADRIPWVNTRRVVLLGGLVGGIMSMLRRAQGRLVAARDESSDEDK